MLGAPDRLDQAGLSVDSTRTVGLDKPAFNRGQLVAPQVAVRHGHATGVAAAQREANLLVATIATKDRTEPLALGVAQANRDSPLLWIDGQFRVVGRRKIAAFEASRFPVTAAGQRRSLLRPFQRNIELNRPVRLQTNHRSGSIRVVGHVPNVACV